MAIFFLLASGWLTAARIPSATQIQIRLTKEVNTSTSKVGDTFEALVIAPVVVNGQIAMAAGATLTGHIKEVTAAVNPDDQAVLALAFDEIRDPSGKKAMIAAKVTSLDHARESLDADGRIQGIIASKTGSGRLDQGINKVSEKYPSFAELLGTVKQAVLKGADANIDLQARRGDDHRADQAVGVDRQRPRAGYRRLSSRRTNWLALVNSEPFRTATEKDHAPSDITDLMFLGSRQQMEDAFQKAGWSPAAKLSDQSKLETFRAMAEMRGYQEAPVSVLLLDGRPPDLVFEKINDTSPLGIICEFGNGPAFSTENRSGYARRRMTPASAFPMRAARSSTRSIRRSIWSGPRWSTICCSRGWCEGLHWWNEALCRKTCSMRRAMRSRPRARWLWSVSSRPSSIIGS